MVTAPPVVRRIKLLGKALQNTSFNVVRRAACAITENMIFLAQKISAKCKVGQGTFPCPT
jgi:hypothetical protein